MKIRDEQVTGYINQASDEQRRIMETVRDLLHDSIKGIKEEIKWSRPVFNNGTDLVYFKTAKSYVTVGFFNYNKLSDPDSLLEGTGKDMRHIKIRKHEEVDKELLKRWFKELES